ncbi:hypothetical protein HDE70_005193 [Pedobacter cryoconitis]|nr:hypothetical protein [Pedobacter cryoconitis]
MPLARFNLQYTTNKPKLCLNKYDNLYIKTSDPGLYVYNKTAINC